VQQHYHLTRVLPTNALSDFLKSSAGSTSPTLNKIGNLSFTFPFITISLCPVSEIASPVSGKIHSKTEFPPYLKDLFEQSVKDLSPEQGSKVKHPDFLKSSVGSTSPTLNKIGNLSFTFPFTTISLCGGITTVSETVTL
jgi:hypothetical protein